MFVLRNIVSKTFAQALKPGSGFHGETQPHFCFNLKGPRYFFVFEVTYWKFGRETLMVFTLHSYSYPLISEKLFALCKYCKKAILSSHIKERIKKYSR